MTDASKPEVVTVSRWLAASYAVVVHNYSNDAPLAGSDAEVVLERDGETRVFRSPDDHLGRVWRVCSIDGRTGDVSPEIDPRLVDVIEGFERGHA